MVKGIRMRWNSGVLRRVLREATRGCFGAAELADGGVGGAAGMKNDGMVAIVD